MSAQPWPSPKGSRQSRALAVLLLLLFIQSAASGATNRVVVVSVNGTIGPGTVELIQGALESAEGAEALVLVLDTPGGQLEATMDIVGMIEGSPVPVIGFVPPSGAAWSAGTIILLSTHLAAMAPGSVIGSCQPVILGPSGNATPADNKTVKAIREYVVERAKIHGRNVTAAERFVTENLNMGAEEALKAGVIELIADDLSDLLRKADGMTVRTVAGNVILRTAGATVEYYRPGIGVRILNWLSDPSVYSLLLSLGLLILMIGLFTPGYVGEVVGALLLVLALVGMGLVPRAIGAVILLALGAIFLAYELITPGFAFFGFTGITLMIIGLVLVMGVPMLVKGTGSAFWVLVVLLAVFVGFAAFLLYKAFRAQRRRPIELGPIGKEGIVEEPLGPGREGYVRVENELWKATADEEIGVGERVRVVSKEGPILKVEKVQ
ncbi:MAG TPA: nodulation protein NfeD [Aciduliprofundum sp.]|nr:nodulation protein NfeD [Aciduliprofundum sp.]